MKKIDGEFMKNKYGITLISLVVTIVLNSSYLGMERIYMYNVWLVKRDNFWYNWKS